MPNDPMVRGENICISFNGIVDGICLFDTFERPDEGDYPSNYSPTREKVKDKDCEAVFVVTDGCNDGWEEVKGDGCYCNNHRVLFFIVEEDIDTIGSGLVGFEHFISDAAEVNHDIVLVRGDKYLTGCLGGIGTSGVVLDFDH